MKRIENANKKIVIYEPTLNVEEFYGHEVVKDLEEFKEKCTVIVANRMETELKGAENKLYTRDLYMRD